MNFSILKSRNNLHICNCQRELYCRVINLMTVKLVRRTKKEKSIIDMGILKHFKSVQSLKNGYGWICVSLFCESSTSWKVREDIRKNDPKNLENAKKIKLRKNGNPALVIFLTKLLFNEFRRYSFPNESFLFLFLLLLSLTLKFMSFLVSCALVLFVPSNLTLFSSFFFERVNLNEKTMKQNKVSNRNSVSEQCSIVTEKNSVIKVDGLTGRLGRSKSRLKIQMSFSRKEKFNLHFTHEPFENLRNRDEKRSQ